MPDRYLDINGKNKAEFTSKASLIIRSRTMPVSLITKSILPQNLNSSFLIGILEPNNKNNGLPFLHSKTENKQLNCEY